MGRVLEETRGGQEMTKDKAIEILQDVPIEVYTAIKWHTKEREDNK